MQTIIDRHRQGYERRKQWKDCFDLEVWRKSESYALIKNYVRHSDKIVEIGTLTGHNLLLLANDGYDNYLLGIDFLKEAINWAKDKRDELKLNVHFICAIYPEETNFAECFDTIILFDTIEHVSNLQEFLIAVNKDLVPTGQILILVPKGKEYYDIGHINFFPDAECLRNHLELYFKVEEIREVEGGKKIFARCSKLPVSETKD